MNFILNEIITYPGHPSFKKEGRILGVEFDFFNIPWGASLTPIRIEIRTSEYTNAEIRSCFLLISAFKCS